MKLNEFWKMGTFTRSHNAMRNRLFLLATLLSCAVFTSARAQPIIWNIKAILPDGRTLDVKAFGPDGKPIPVKALDGGDTHLMDVKALTDGGQLPIKVIASDDAFLPVKAITAEGKLWDVKAIAPDGTKLDVKGVARAGHIIHIKAIGPDLELYGVKAISPAGIIHDIKGIRTTDKPAEATVNGVQVAAHIKALPQAVAADEDPIWNVKAIGTDGHFIPVKALDKNGGIHNVKAFMENGDRWIMDVKALIDGRKAAVKMLVSEDPLIPVKAIAADGTIYDIKALAPDGRKLDVKGTTQDGNIIHLKAIDGDRQLGVKAVSPHGAQYDVKGLKFMKEKQEGLENGIPFRAHVKAVPPAE